MFKSYFTVAWRNIRKSKWYSFINTFGLSIGMAVALLIALWIWDEVTYNHYFTRHGRLAQVMTTQTYNEHRGTGNAVSLPLRKALPTQFSADFKQLSQASWNFGHIVAYGDKKLSEEGMWVEPNFPEMLTIRMVAGNRDALKDPSSILICQSVAASLFGTEDPLNKTIKLDNKDLLKVGGVYEDFPRNTNFYDTKILVAWDHYRANNDWIKKAETQWNNHSWQLFVELPPNVDFAKVTEKIKYLPKAHKKEGNEEIILQPMDNWRLYSHFTNGKVDGGRITFVWLFGIIGLFVLLLACINFMNLSTARSEKRAREVGIRKTIGSLRRQLVAQFLSESLVVALLAFLFAIAWVALSLPYFNKIADKEMRLPWGQPVFWLLALSFTLFTGMLAGSYPAFYLSGFKAIRVLKGTFKAGRYAALPRQILVVLQFTVSVALIIGTILVYRQIDHARNRPVGYSREGLLTIFMTTPDIYGHYEAIRNDLLRTGAVEDMSESSSPVTDVWSNQIGFDWKGKDPNTEPLFGIVACTHDFGHTMGWSIKEGRDFSRQFADTGQTVLGVGSAPGASADTFGGSLILNEAAVKLTGLAHVSGETIKWNGRNHRVAGVVRDMLMESPYAPVKPTIFYCDYGWANVITVRVKPTMPVKQALTAIGPVFRKYNPGAEFEYKFVDEDYARKFSDEQRIGHLATVFAILAIFISCLGLFGMASFVAEQRTKEIGVRKVLGASIFHLWRMLSRDFLLLVLIACLIAMPIAGVVLSKWLQKYEYRTSLSWWVFAAAAFGAMFITVCTVSYQAIRAASTNPVKSLRTE
jgi:ABC-type antimicrobial peptide transport system permease subunit